MSIDQATIARRRDLLAICDKTGNPYGPEQATLFVEARAHLPALLDAAEREAELYRLMNRARGLLIDRNIAGTITKEERAHLLVLNAFVDARLNAINDAAMSAKGHDWGNDGAHSNQFCKRCFVTRTPQNEATECAGKGDHAEG